MHTTLAAPHASLLPPISILYPRKARPRARNWIGISFPESGKLLRCGARDAFLGLVDRFDKDLVFRCIDDGSGDFFALLAFSGQTPLMAARQAARVIGYRFEAALEVPVSTVLTRIDSVDDVVSLAASLH